MRIVKCILCIAFLLSQLFCVALAGVYDNGDEYDDPPKIKTPVYAITEGIDLVSTKKLEYGKPRIVIRSVYPKLENNEAENDENITNFNQLIEIILKEAIDDYTNLVQDEQDFQKNLPRKQVRNSLYTDYDTSVIKLKRNRIISLRFTIQGHIAGVKGAYRAHKVLNYNMDEDSIIQLSDLFVDGSDYLNILSKYTSEHLSKHLSNRNMIYQGTTPTLNHFKNWNIKANGLLITFDENEVAPSIYGTQTVLVPFRVLKEVIAHDSPIFDCVKNKYRCARGSILTGGFIDEARRDVKHKTYAGLPLKVSLK